MATTSRKALLMAATFFILLLKGYQNVNFCFLLINTILGRHRIIYKSRKITVNILMKILLLCRWESSSSLKYQCLENLWWCWLIGNSKHNDVYKRGNEKYSLFAQIYKSKVSLLVMKLILKCRCKAKRTVGFEDISVMGDACWLF